MSEKPVASIHGRPIHLARPRMNKTSSKLKMQMAQTTALRYRKDVKVTLAEEPWKKKKEASNP